MNERPPEDEPTQPTPVVDAGEPTQLLPVIPAVGRAEPAVEPVDRRSPELTFVAIAVVVLLLGGVAAALAMRSSTHAPSAPNTSPVRSPSRTTIATTRSTTGRSTTAAPATVPPTAPPTT